MISIVLYGRNDNYGYNLHKRAALSLNCMAEVLTDSSDEILFVDYNTPDDFPTFPEAIQDTLTRRAREMLRILRVRPCIHERFKSKTRLLALEPIARNVAVRRSSAANRWILSTNTDMIFVSLRSRSLSEIARGLAPGFYHAPRIEIPEVLWEGLDRNDPIDVINTVRKWGTTLHLNEIVLGSQFIRYDGPGDFQLLLRSDLFDNHGFDEEMLLGWHVDSNIAARMLLKYAEVGDLGAHVYGYHCDHTRQVTPAHSHNRVQNDCRRFVAEIARPDVPGQAASWGCAGDAIEEVRLPSKPSSVYVQALRGVIGEPLGAAKVVEYTGEVYNKVDYDPRHLLPFLADMFVPMPRTSNLAWYGARATTLGLFASIWEKLNFTGKILLDRPALQPLVAAPISHVVPSRALAEADAFVFDFGGLPTSIGQSIGVNDVSSDLRRSFLQVVRQERRRLSQGAAPRRVIALNAVNNEYEGFVCGSVAAAATPFATHMRHGFVLPAGTAKEAWLSLLSIGEAGVRVGDQIRSDPTKAGWIAYGPHRHLDEGVYLVSVSIELLADEPNRFKNEPCVFIEVRASSELLAIHLLRYGELKNADCKFAFVVSENIAEGIYGIETRIVALSPIGIVVRALTVEPSSAPISDEERSAAALQIKDWLPFLRLGPLGRIDEWGVFAETGSPAFVAYGPYWSVPPGKYEMVVLIERGDEAPIPEHLVRADVVVGNRQLIAGNFYLAALPYDGERAVSVLRLPFELNDPAPERRQVETRIFSSGEEPFRIRSLSIKPVERRKRNDLLPFLLIGEAGLRAGGTIRNVDKRIGLAAYSPTIALDPGAYQLSLRVTVQTDAGTAVREERPYAIVLVKYGAEILAVDAITFEGGQRGNYALTFETPAVAAPTDGFEFLFQVISAADVTLHTLVLEHVASVVPATGPAVCALGNWLPFLRRAPSAHADQDGIMISGGRAEYAVWGPYWTLPAGHYEVIAAVVPQSSNLDGKPVITFDVCTEEGKRQFAVNQWRLGQVQKTNGQVDELRLPFTLGADLPAALRKIETRIYTSGDGCFRIRSLMVRASPDELKEPSVHHWGAGALIHARGKFRSILRDQPYAAAARIFRKLRATLKIIKFVKRP